MGKFFGTDGIRGIANKELTIDLAMLTAKASSHILEKELGRKPTIIIGKDTRISGDMLEAAMVSAFNSVGANVKLLGVIPTPAVAYLVRMYNADAGVVISASHNSFEFNGIKYFSSQGIKLSEKIEEEIEEQIVFECKQIMPELNEKIGKTEIISGACKDYLEFLKTSIGEINLNLKVGLDCANGATSGYAKSIFEDLGIYVNVINETPDGININTNCGSTHIEGLQKFVVDNGLDIGFAYDGDGDRLLAVDENGNLLDGDVIMAMCGKYLKDTNKLKGDTIVVTVMSNLGLDLFAKQNGIKLVKTKVGDKYVLEEMLNSGYVFGGEQSGHIIFGDFNTTGDGILTSLQILALLSRENIKVSELANIITIYPQVTINAKVQNDKKHEYIDDIEIQDQIKKLEKEFADEGRVLIRPSGTEPLVRVMIEGKDKQYITKRAIELAEMLEKKYI